MVRWMGVHLLGLMALTAVPASAAPFDDGIDAYYQNDFAKALRLWLPLAEDGNANAQNNLGAMYENGQGVAADMKEAARWYRRAAEQAHTDGQMNLGRLYTTGQGIPEDLVRAHMWLTIATDRSMGGMLWGAADALAARTAVAARLTPEQLTLARQMAKRCVESNYWECN